MTIIVFLNDRSPCQITMIQNFPFLSSFFFLTNKWKRLKKIHFVKIHIHFISRSVLWNLRSIFCITYSITCILDKLSDIRIQYVFIVFEDSEKCQKRNCSKLKFALMKNVFQGHLEHFENVDDFFFLNGLKYFYYQIIVP